METYTIYRHSDNREYSPKTATSFTSHLHSLALSFHVTITAFFSDHTSLLQFSSLELMRVDQVSPSQLRDFLLVSLSNRRYVRFFNRLVLSIKRVKNNEKLFLGLNALR